MEPLAHRMRPKTLDDIIGQNHLTGQNGVIRKMIEKDLLQSFILYGEPGTGKTSIAKIIKTHYEFNTYEFNASSDSKNVLKEVSDLTKFHQKVILIIDEIHRMKKDTQDYLLPFLEDGRITIIGLTTTNPYLTVNKAIRSRLNIYQMNRITKNDILDLLNKAIQDDEFKGLEINDEVLNLISIKSGCEIRTALNMLESLKLIDGKITLENAKVVTGEAMRNFDFKEDGYYDLLSAFQKSIRGSDVDASLYYLARLLKQGDLDIIVRRLQTIAYEDIGLANPGVGPKVYAATEIALKLGMPEARIPLASIVIDLALSPKSNTSEAAIDNALNYLDSHELYDIPKNILNREIKGDSTLYKYPHDFNGGIVYQEYLPPQMHNIRFYKAKDTGKYERALAENNEKIRNILKKST